ncbi:MAG: hypothetical protein HQM15_08775 [Deltaproteobacteria bacterium]|nr:hypothetical protein [Deltaproteobacteria bacterium]
MKLLSKILLSLFIVSLAACGGSGGGSDQQISGVIAEADFSTAVCQPATKIVNIRNEDLNEPQRVQSLGFELGTNPTGFFTISKAMVGSTEFTGADLTNIVIPAGGMLSIYANYNPRPDASGHIIPSATSYISLFLNGPRLGIPQIKLNGSTDPNSDLSVCGQILKFNITSVKLTANTPATPTGTAQDVPVSGSTLQISVRDNVASISKNDLSTINMLGFPANLDDGTFEGQFDGSKINFDRVSFNIANAIHFIGKLTTDTATATNGSINISKTGTALASGHAKVVFAASIPNETVVPAQYQGGVVAVEIELQQFGN